MTAINESKARLKGIFNITVTPFAADGSIDYSSLDQSIERIISMGFDGLLIGGTYGEFPTMSGEERAALFRRVIDVARNRVAVLLCSAHTDPRAALDLTGLASQLGGIPMVTPPFASEVNDEHIVSFFKLMALATSAGLVIYNAPGVGITLSPQLIERLSDIQGIIGLKQGDLDPTTIDFLASRLSGKIKLFCASDLAFLGPTLAGFDGLSSTNSCALPELILATYRALEAGDAHTATRLHRSWYPYRALARRFGQPQTVKAAMTHRGWNGGTVRRPLQALQIGQLDQLVDVLSAILATSQEPSVVRKIRNA